MKIKIFVARETRYFEIGIFSFNLYVYYLTRGFITPTHAFYLPTRAFNLATHVFSLLTGGFELVVSGFELVHRGFELVTRVLLFHAFLLYQQYVLGLPSAIIRLYPFFTSKHEF